MYGEYVCMYVFAWLARLTWRMGGVVGESLWVGVAWPLLLTAWWEEKMGRLSGMPRLEDGLSYIHR